ncbi:hypothetical protein BOTBODRAFT_170188 [Botryobasidium botryosum FD-172 SS1]|uniref:J domain-containing protein n=1 Tax=Botryobasidium botryosum (strain FD-172 SS1) TaxID=930990 RepID=A0A067MZQ1_BOTB1|nr:hypothetical protein BOTBODRAFT_170188 [Botryobasidium botryosum FD-172 SS1]
MSAPSMNLSPVAAAIASLVGWSILPNFLTRIALSLARSIGLPFAQSPDIPTSSRTYRITYSLVIASYLLYTIFAAIRTAPLSLYEILGCAPGATEGELKQAFRSFAKKNHPDHVGPQGERAFMVVRDAFEALKNPVKRFAYDRFGPGALEWTSITYREYIHQGIMSSLGFYVSTAVFTLGFSFLGKDHSQTFLRFLLLATLSALELALTVDAETTPSIPLLNFFLPRRMPYQHVSFLRQCCFSISIAMYRIAPVLFPTPPVQALFSQLTAEEVVQAFAPRIDQLQNLSNYAAAESCRMLQMELTALRGTRPAPPQLVHQITTPRVQDFPVSDDLLTQLFREMRKLELDAQIRSHPMLRSILQNVVQRRFEAGAGGAPVPTAENLVASEGDLPTPRSSLSPHNTRAPSPQTALRSPSSASVTPSEPMPRQIFQTFSSTALGDVD